MDNRLFIAMAPMEGVTTAIYRNVYRKYFGGVDAYFTPFLSLNQTHTFKKREKREVIPYREDLIPQVLTNSCEDFVWGATELGALGYSEININMGCPSGTVFAKNKGSGMLRNPDNMKQFLEDIFKEKDRHNLPEISVKLRTGVEDAGEAKQLAGIISQFPFCEVIVHPRLRKDYYNGECDLDAFDIFKKAISTGPYADSTQIMYNGDLNDIDDVAKFTNRFPDVNRIMLGRGLLGNPALAEQITNESAEITDRGRKLYDFIANLFLAYEPELACERDVLFKMKDLMTFMISDEQKDSKAAKRIKKAKNKADFLTAVKDYMDCI